MARSRYPFIARQGWGLIAASLAAAVAGGQFLGWLWTLPFLALAVVFGYLFRDPRRQVPSAPLGIVSPADGVVRAVEPTRDPFLQRDAIRVTLNIRGWDVYTTRSPIEGKIMDMVDAPQKDGKPRHGVWIKTDEGDDIVIAMHRGPMQTIPRCFVQCGERVGQGQRCGFIYFGSLVEVFLPANSRVDVKPGDDIHGGKDLLGLLVHKAE